MKNGIRERNYETQTSTNDLRNKTNFKKRTKTESEKWNSRNKLRNRHIKKRPFTNELRKTEFEKTDFENLNLKNELGKKISKE